MSRTVLSSNIQIDDHADMVTIYGIRYSGEFFRCLGLDPEGTCIRVLNRHDGVVALQRIPDPEKKATP